MGNPQDITNATFTGSPTSYSPSDLSPGPGQPGINFTTSGASITITFAPGVTPIVTQISVPNTNTNVNQTRVVIRAPNKTVIVDDVSPQGTPNTVTQFPLTPLPENSTVTITFTTNNNQPPQNVTISIIACYTPANATTVVTSGTTPPTITGSKPTLTISSITITGTQVTGKLL